MTRSCTRRRKASANPFIRILTFGAIALSFIAIDIGTASAQLDEIMVRARKREESARNIPVAVTLVSSEQLDRYNLKSLSAVAENDPVADDLP